MTSKLLSLRLIFVLLILALPVTAQQDFTIQKIEFEGLNRMSSEEVIATTGLKVGEHFALKSLDDAAQKLMDSGLFSKVGYKTRADKKQITITFQVEEATVTNSRVVFDNFIWFNDTELIGAIKRDLPTFTGTAPDNGDTVERIVKSLQRFLHENKIEATVSHMASQDAPGSSGQEHIFTVNGVSLPICTIHFPGAKNVTEARLIDGAKELKGADYSRKFVSLFADTNLISMYREVGQLKAAFSPPLAKPEATANCKSGVELTIPVDEGYIYKWDRADWTGNTLLTTKELDALLGMKSGQTVNGVKLAQAQVEIKEAYGRKGFLLARVKSEPTFDDQVQSVAYKMSLIEGPQFKMGTFTIKGFSDSEAKTLQSRWELKPGDVFDADYTKEFTKNRMDEVMRSTLMRRLADGKKTPPSMNWLIKPDRQALTVDVTLELTN